MEETEHAKDRVKEGVEHAKDKVKQGVTHAKETVEAGVDHVKTFGQQTTKEVRERGMEGARDMAEGYQKAGQEMIQGGKDAVKERMPSTSDSSFDFARMGRFMLYNFSVAPIIHGWYTVLDKKFPIQSTSNPAVSSVAATKIPAPNSKFVQTMTPALKRMVGDQVLFAPVGLALLFSGLTVLEGGGIEEIKDKLNSTYIDALKANYAVWPLVQLVNFSVMPLQLRLPFVSVVGIAWNAYLSFANNKGRLAETHQA
ncbi:hypothetical protein BC939DRAFT_425626 [Gamsiella multidivaricata]|uniref:uncharacterized protein n=1 Tax=Gamsiella multidivaricata TaxID=101098 RepID=UPI00221FE733|nr:uncharacterized protein BC939DRAFT_425626 [Gamsiella multidivaricata]KAI7820783.1 hypothetical protein BC939DRAFT_425626 [Gamsiella multidivaricata]